MKVTSLLFVAALIAHTTATSPLPPTPALSYAGPLRSVGTVSASGANTLGDLVIALTDRAHRQRAITWWVNATSSGNRLHGSVIIYQ